MPSIVNTNGDSFDRYVINFIRSSIVRADTVKLTDPRERPFTSFDHLFTDIPPTAMRGANTEVQRVKSFITIADIIFAESHFWSIFLIFC
jgi:hypothetical protein